MNESKPENGTKWVERLARQYQQSGYEVKVRPSTADIPFDLGGYQPDLLLSESSGLKYLVEVKGKHALSVDRLREIAEKVSQQPGWRFLLVTDHDELGADVDPQAEKLLQVGQIRQRLDDAGRMLTEGHREAAFLWLWTAFEAALRRRAVAADLPIERLSASSIVNYLYSEGELSLNQFELAGGLIKTRNSVAHGYQISELEEAARSLGQLTRELISGTESRA
jgi:hypothetical protein